MISRLFRNNVVCNSVRRPQALFIPRYHFSSSRKPSFDTSADYYQILGVKPTASDSEVKKQFYLMAKKYHPDNTQQESR